MLPLGTVLPFGVIREEIARGAARQVSGDPLDLEAVGQIPLLVLFICAHCPFVKHVEPEISRLQDDFAPAGAVPRLQVLAISSNSVQTHPQDGPEGLRAQALQHGWRFPYLHDADQVIARAFRAACTPDPYLFAPAGADGELHLVYRGQFDASRPGNDLPCDGADLRAALAAVLAGREPTAEQRPAIGCNIKWHPGAEPEWGR
ncbi:MULTISPECIES: thioredoxin family protein [Aphanothece]|uniref:thioredoxin family protein n=1 Tax=Aphanothece TaxID=1121 RepID=UPI00398F82CB